MRIRQILPKENLETALQQRFNPNLEDLDLELYPVSRELYEIILGIYSGDMEADADFFDQLEDGDVLNYLYSTHDHYLTKRLPEIEQQIEALKGVADEPLLEVLQNYFQEFRKDLTEHILFEERHLFPLLYRLDSVSFGQVHLDTSNHDHKNERELEMIISVLRDRRSTGQEYLGIGVLINTLENLLLDLDIHAFVEEEVLIPRIKTRHA